MLTSVQDGGFPFSHPHPEIGDTVVKILEKHARVTMQGKNIETGFEPVVCARHTANLAAHSQPPEITPAFPDYRLILHKLRRPV